MKTTIAKKAIIGLAIAGMAIAFGGCGDNKASAPKPKNDLERYDAAFKDLKENVDQIKQYEAKALKEYYEKDTDKYAMLKYVADNNQGSYVEIKQLSGYNHTGKDENGKPIRTPMYTKEQATAAAEAVDNIMNSEERTSKVKKIEEDIKIMKEIAEKAENNTNGSLKNKYYEDKKVENQISFEDKDNVVLAQKEYNKMIKITNPKFWKQ